MIDPLPRILFLAVNIFAAVVLVVLLLIVALRARHHRYLRYWILFCVSGVAYLSTVILLGVVSSEALAVPLARLAFSAAGLTMFAMAHFVAAFAAKVRVLRSVHAVLLIWLGLLQVLVWGSDLVVAGVTRTGHLEFVPEVGPLVGFHVAYLLATWSLACGTCINVWRHSFGVKRTQAAYMLVAFIVAAISSSGSLLPSLIGTTSPLAALPHLLLPLFPLTITYAIIRHRLWDVRTIVHRTAAWLLLSALLLAPIYALMHGVDRVLPEMGAGGRATLLVLLFICSYGYVRAIKPRLDHLFQRGTFDRLRALDRFARSMANIGRPEQVVGQVLDTLASTLYPERVKLLCRLDEDSPLLFAARPPLPEDLTPDVPSLVSDSRFFRRMVEGGAAVDRGQLEVDPNYLDVREEAEAYFDRAGAQVCLPLLQGGSLVGLILLDAKKNLRGYSRSDLEFLEQLGASAAIGLSNGHLFERVDSQRRDLEMLNMTLEQRVQERTADLEAANYKLAQANETLKELDQLKNRFFTNISHDLRTPLTLILAPLESILSDRASGLDSRTLERLHGIRRSALLLLRLINDILDLSRLEESRLRLRIDPFDLGALVRRVVDSTLPLAERKSLDVVVQGPGAAVVQADEDRLERVVVNLLSNAIKFTPSGGRIVLRYGERDERAFVIVEDTGIGIPQEELGRIFERFHQVDSSLTRRHGGAGIGLALARELVELHDGTLEVQSELGQGSCFTMEVPASAAKLPPERLDRRVNQHPVSLRRREADMGLPEWTEEILGRPEYRFLDIDAAASTPGGRQVGLPAHGGSQAQPGWEEDPAQPSGRGAAARCGEWTPCPEEELPAGGEPGAVFAAAHAAPGRAWAADEPRGAAGGRGVPAETILIVEDNTSLRRFIAGLLRPDFQVLTAADGARGLELARQELPSLVLCDVMMPVMDGLSFCRALKQDVQTASIPVIVLTARRSNRDAMSAFGAGAQDYVTKPFSNQELMARISAHLQIRRLDRAVARAERMAALGSTAAGLAHEIRNPLNAVINGLEVLADVEEGGEREELLTVIRRSAERILTTVQALQSFVRLDEGGLKRVDLNSGIKDTLTILSHRLLNITVYSELRLDRPVECFPALVNQAIMNLLTNAIDAAGEGGQIRLKTEAAGDCARILVSDSGPGIRAEDRERIFRPYFTTKPVGSGTGMGLAFSRQIVERHGGSLRVTSPAESGAELTLELPLNASGRRPAGATAVAGGAPVQLVGTASAPRSPQERSEASAGEVAAGACCCDAAGRRLEQEEAAGSPPAPAGGAAVP